jgi:hypothetical protein
LKEILIFVQTFRESVEIRNAIPMQVLGCKEKHTGVVVVVVVVVVLGGTGCRFLR